MACEKCLCERVRERVHTQNPFEGEWRRRVCAAISLSKHETDVLYILIRKNSFFTEKNGNALARAQYMEST